MMDKTKLKQLIIDYLGITVGSAITALGLVLFLIPNRIAAGGISGLSTVIFYLTGIPVGIMMLIINIPLFLAAVRILGIAVGVRTVYGMVVLSLFVSLFQPYFSGLTADLLLATIWGGIVGGFGLSIVFRFRGTTGGTDLIARLINHFSGLSIGQGLLLADGVIVLLAGVLLNVEVALYAALAIIINSKTIDLFQEGFGFTKAAFVISFRPEAIREGIISRLNRGVTVLHGYGGYTGEAKDVLLCIISRSEVTRLKRMVNELDPQAFIIITNVNEVLGEGFKELE